MGLSPSISPRDRSMPGGRGLQCDFEHIEEKGGANPTIMAIAEFGETIMDRALLDTGYEGSMYTWHWRRLWKRLDRVLISQLWADNFVMTKVQHLAMMESDHLHLMINLNRTIEKNHLPLGL